MREQRSAHAAEVTAWLLFAVCLGAMEGGVVSVLVKAFYRQTVAAATLDYTVALLVSAPLFANLASLGWAAAGQGRGPGRLLVPLQLLCVLCLLLVAAAPRTPSGLALLAVGAVGARLLWSGVLTLRSSMWRLSYDRQDRARLGGRVVAVHYLAIAATAALVGAVAERRPEALPWLYGAIAALGVGGAALYADLRRGAAARDGLEPEPEAPDGGQGWLRTFRDILRRDVGFRRYLGWLFVLDGGVQMTAAPLLICFADRFLLTPVAQILLITAVPMVVVPAVMPLLSRQLSRMHVIRFRAFHSWFFAAALLFYVAGLTLRIEPCLWFGAVLLGIGYAGGSLTWHLGHHDFATPEQSPHYMSLNIALTGVRGIAGQAAGVSLYKLVEHLLPGQGALALLVPLALTIYGAWGFVRLARQPLATPALFPATLRPAVGALS